MIINYSNLKKTKYFECNLAHGIIIITYTCIIISMALRVNR